MRSDKQIGCISRFLVILQKSKIFYLTPFVKNTSLFKIIIIEVQNIYNPIEISLISALLREKLFSISLERRLPHSH